MALPIGSTPHLTGFGAKRFLESMEKAKNRKLDSITYARMEKNYKEMLEAFNKHNKEII